MVIHTYSDGSIPRSCWIVGPAVATMAEFERHQLPDVIAEARAVVARLGG